MSHQDFSEWLRGVLRGWPPIGRRSVATADGPSRHRAGVHVTHLREHLFELAAARARGEARDQRAQRAHLRLAKRGLRDPPRRLEPRRSPPSSPCPPSSRQAWGPAPSRSATGRSASLPASRRRPEARPRAVPHSALAVAALGRRPLAARYLRRRGVGRPRPPLLGARQGRHRAGSRHQPTRDHGSAQLRARREYARQSLYWTPRRRNRRHEPGQTLHRRHHERRRAVAPRIAKQIGNRGRSTRSPHRMSVRAISTTSATRRGQQRWRRSAITSRASTTPSVGTRTSATSVRLSSN